MSAKKPYSIAVVGIGGVFPNAGDVHAFWDNVVNCVDASVEVPKEHWVDDPKWYASQKSADRVSSLRVCLLGEQPQPKAQFDEPLDLLCEMSLAAAEMAIADCQAGIADRSKVATILASIALPTKESSQLSEEFFLNHLGQSLDPPVQAPQTEMFPHAREVTARPAQVVAQALDLGGYTLTLDAACASSLYAVKLACDALTEKRADAVLAGGANRADTLYTQEGFTALGACSLTGKCSPFDAKGDGLVVGEGAGFLLLKRVEDAVAQGDRIYAVIRGIGLSNDVGGSLLAPDSEGQLRALVSAYEQAQWKADAVGLVECHGTGTPKGDVTEFKSLTSFWPKSSKKTTVLGSVKSQIGHLLTGAAAAGLIKTIMAIHHRTLPPMINFESPAKGIDLDQSPFEILSAPRPWKHNGPLRAGVSAFGFGGINGHVLLEEPNNLSTARTHETAKRDVVVTAVGAKMGQEHDLERMLCEMISGETSFTERPQDRWPDAEALPEELLSLRGLFLDELQVEAGSMRIPPKDMGDVLIQQSLLLAVAGETTKKSQLGDKERCRRSGALIGLSLDLETTNYHLRWALSRMLKRLGVDPASLTDEQKSKLRDTLSRPLDSTRTLGALGSIVASRAAREFSLGGPSYAISCGEVSGIRALEVGARAIANGEMDSCLVGAIDLAADPRSVWTQDEMSPYTRNNVPKPFSADADGATIAEGAVVLVLKSREAALADGDEILGRVENICSAAGSGSLARVVEQLAQKAQPREIGYADFVSRAEIDKDQEFLSLWESNFSESSRATAMGTATAQVGFAGACSGLLSVLRCLQALEHKIVPGLPNCPQPLESGKSHFLPRESAFWWHDFAQGPRQAVSVGEARGGDAYALRISEETPVGKGLEKRMRAKSLPCQLFLIPQGTLAELVSLSKTGQDLPDLARLWATRVNEAAQNESPKGPRGALVCRSVDELKKGLSLLQRRAAEGENLQGQAGVYFQNEAPKGETAWVFPGSGNHYAGMGRELALYFPEVASEVCAEAQCSFQHYTPWLTQPFNSDRSEGWKDRARQAIDADPLAPIFSQVTYAILAARVLGQFLPQPDAAVGYSLGETAAFFATGTWTERDDMFHRTVGSPLFNEELRGHYSVAKALLGIPLETDWKWRVVVLNRSRKDVEKALPEHTYLLIENTAKECVVGGTPEGVAQLVKDLKCEAFDLDGVPTVHCPFMHPVEDSYRELHRLKTTPPKGMRFYNGHQAKAYKPKKETAAASITENALHGFSLPKLIQQAYKDGARKFIEIGPGGSCARMIRSILEGKEHWTRSVSLPRETGEIASLFGVLAGAFVQGSPVKLEALYPVALQPESAKKRPKVKVKAGDSLARVAAEKVRWNKPHSQGSSEPGMPRAGTTPARTQPPLPSSVSGPSPAAALTVPPSSNGGGAAPGRSGALALAKTASTVSQPLTAGTTQAQSARTPSSPRVPSKSPTQHGSPKGKGALVWRRAQQNSPQTLLKKSNKTTKDNSIMANQDIQDLEPVIGLHPDYAGDPSAHLAASIVESTRQTAQAHEAYLKLMEDTQIKMQNLLAGTVSFGATQTVPHQAEIGSGTQQHPPSAGPGPWVKLDPGSSNPVMRGERPHRDNVAFDRDMCMEFAIGSVAKVLGEKFASVDNNQVRVRLPDEPLMLCDRILSVEGEPNSLGSGRLVTEHDVFPESWYLDHDRAPVCISVEAGQADLFLCSYLGIDLATDGTRAYRLLDATVSFHRGLPQPGETILYDIRINKFVKQGEVYLFFFEFDGTINGEPLITMRNGCAGFHTYEEIASSGGIVLTNDEKKPAPGKAPAGWAPLAPFPQGLNVSESYNDAQVEAFRNHDLVGCFGQSFAGLPITKPYGLPKGRMKLFDRVLSVEPTGGRFGLGRVTAEADIHPDDWFLTCHFKDDMVMPGTLMYECCAHTLRFLLARMGWVCEESQVAFEPCLNTPAALRCRGPVTTETQKVVYQVDIKEIGYGPEPYVVTDALMFGDGKAIVRFVDMSMKLTGLTEQDLTSIWAGAQSTSNGVAAAPAVNDIHAPYRAMPELYSKETIMQFSNGKPSLAFGPEYIPFDHERRIARLPGPPYQFMDRVTEADHPKFVLEKGGWIEAHYDIPYEEWYFAANRQPSMAYCILLEAALQPCGWLAAYAGSALRSDSDLKFRNLGGTATLIKEVFPNTGMIRMRVRMTDVNEAGGMIIENFDMQVYCGDELIYDGTTYFGFFSKAALAKQVGVRDAADRTYVPTDSEWKGFAPEVLPVVHPMNPDDRSTEPATALNMPAKALLMMDQVDLFLPNSGGTKGLGFIQGSKMVDPDEWFFKAHFYQDPVWPGSLGLEAFLQLLRYAALHYWPHLANTHRFESIALGMEHTWAYRGQVIPTNKKVIVDCSITQKIDGECPVLVGAGFLRVDGTPIYEMMDFGVRLVPD